MKLVAVSGSRNNNLDLMRFIAAALVILSHAFPISMGAESADILTNFSKGQIGLGNFAVCLFFVYGGYLIAGSAERKRQTLPFFKARIVRLFPQLIITTFITALILGPLVSSLPVNEYFASSSTWKYLLNSFMALIHTLPGVFTNNAYPEVVNGVLWTLPVEFICYILIFVIYKLGLMTKKRMPFVILLFAAAYVAGHHILGAGSLLASALRPAGMFFAGMVYYVYREHVDMKALWAAAAGALFTLGILLGITELMALLTLPYIFLYFGYGLKYKRADFAKHGETTYGTYLCAWPIQQTLVQLFGGQMSPYVNFIITWPLAVLCGFLLDRFIDRPIAKHMSRSKN